MEAKEEKQREIEKSQIKVGVGGGARAGQSGMRGRRGGADAQPAAGRE